MIKIAVTKGRIEQKMCELMEKANFDILPIVNKNRELKIKTKDNLEFIFVKSSDVLTYIRAGIVDMGVVGSDTLLESNNNEYSRILDLNVGKCSFALCSYPGYKKDGASKRCEIIATKYPNITKKFFDQKNRNVKIVKLNGSVELGPIVGLSDAIVDIVETGETLKANGLEVVEKVCDVSTQLIASTESLKLKCGEIESFVNQLTKAM